MRRSLVLWWAAGVAIFACTSSPRTDSEATGEEEAAGDGGEMAGGRVDDPDFASGGGTNAAGSGGIRTEPPSAGASGGVAAGGGTSTTSTGGRMAAGGAGGSGLSCAELSNCDSFEAYASGSRPAGPWTAFEVSGGSLSVDETRSFGTGKKSLKISVSPGGEMLARMQHKGTGVLPAESLYMRMMVYMDEAPKGSGHWNWMGAEGTVAAKSGGRLSNAYVGNGGNLTGGSTWMIYAAGANGGFQDCFSAASTKLPTKQWACFELYLDAKTDRALAWVNGKPDDLLSVDAAVPLAGNCVPGFDYTNGKWFIPRLEKLYFGWRMYHTLAAPAAAWLDDIAIGTTRIGCPAAPR